MAFIKRLLISSCLIAVFLYSHPALAESLSSTSDIFDTGIENLRTGDYQSAIAFFTDVIERKDSMLGIAYSNRCLAYLQIQDNIAAEADCIAAIKIRPKNIEAYLNLGLTYYRKREYQKAIAVAAKATEIKPQDYRGYYNEGLAYSAYHDYKSAIDSFKKALAYSDTESKSPIYNDLALAYLMQKDYPPAITNFDKAIALEYDNYLAYYNRGCTYHQQQDYFSAIEDFSKAIELEPNFAQAYVHRGLISHQLGAKMQAFRDFNSALQQYHQQGNYPQYKLVSRIRKQLFSVTTGHYV